MRPPLSLQSRCRRCKDEVDYYSYQSHPILKYLKYSYWHCLLIITSVDNNELLWFTDYLSDRSQAVNVDGCLSYFSNNNTGVPQRSISCPLLFLIFVNDFPTCLGIRL